MSGDDWRDLSATWQAAPAPSADTLLREIRRLQRRRRLLFAVELAGTICTLALIAFVWFDLPAERLDARQWLCAAAALTVGGQSLHWLLRRRYGLFSAPAASIVGLLDQRIRAERYVLAQLGVGTTLCVVVLFVARALLPLADPFKLLVAGVLPTLASFVWALWRARRAARALERLHAERNALGDG
jgi:hypothetical protein